MQRLSAMKHEADTHPIIVACQWKRSSGDVGPAHQRQSHVSTLLPDNASLQLVLFMQQGTPAASKRTEHMMGLHSKPSRVAPYQRCKTWEGLSGGPSIPVMRMKDGEQCFLKSKFCFGE